MSSNRAAANRPFLPRCVRPGSVALCPTCSAAGGLVVSPCGALRNGRTAGSRAFCRDPFTRHSWSPACRRSQSGPGVLFCVTLTTQKGAGHGVAGVHQLFEGAVELVCRDLEPIRRFEVV